MKTKEKIENIVNSRLPFLRDEDKKALINDFLSIINEVLKEKDAVIGEKLKLEQKLKSLNKELKVKFNKDESKTIAFQLGDSIIKGVKDPKTGLINLPSTSLGIFKESVKRRAKKKNARKSERILNILLENYKSNENILPNSEVPKNIIKDIREYIDINKDFNRISYDYNKDFWPKKEKQARFISVLDEISELSWSEEFNLFPLIRDRFVEQISNSTSNGLFIESCWKGNKGKWEYAFTSPGLKHQNAQDLIKAIGIARKNKLPVLFWNKEDPMHYDKFLPIAKKCDIVFTTDTNRIQSYKRDLGHDRVFCLPFAANPYICNPLNRSRYQEENLCFAGSYYSEGHDDRKTQMDKILPVILKLDGVIYDRMSSLDNKRYYFPKQYQNVIRNSVSFKDMTALYKHFKLFLNVNTITDSPTMMSRRVYELLACGTPVISTPCSALEKQFPNIVKIANNAEEAEVIARDLLINPWKHARLSHLGYREVMLHHTYDNRKNIILKALEREEINNEPLVSIILPTMRPHYIDRIVDNICKQKYFNLECIIIAQGYKDSEITELKTKLSLFNNIEYKIIENNTKDNLGKRLNQAIELSNGEYIAKFDDDDLYFPNYLIDMMLPFKFGDWSVVGKKEGFFYFEERDEVVVKYPNQRHIDTDFVMGATMIIKKSDLIEVGGFLEAAKGEDSDLLKRMRINGKKIYAADPFNFIVWRSKENSAHSWVMNSDFLKKNVEFIGKGFNENTIVL